MIESRCKWCNNKIIRGGKKAGIFCSRECRGEWQKVNLRGVNNPNYRHGIYAFEHYCKCGNERDSRALQCSSCARVSYGKNGSVNAWHLSNKQIEDAITTVYSFKELAQKLNVSRHYVTKMVKRNNIDYSHFISGRGRYLGREKLLIKGDKRRNNPVKAFLIKENLVEYKCAECGLFAEWNQKKLTLQLNHINGDGCDNRLENLQFLCPNCHTQTPTYTGRNKKYEREKE